MTAKVLPGNAEVKELVGKTLIPKYWHPVHEDIIWVDCVEDPKLSRWVFYLFLDNWRTGLHYG